VQESLYDFLLDRRLPIDQLKRFLGGAVCAEVAERAPVADPVFGTSGICVTGGFDD
jgi:hypothetical protein